MAEENSRQFVIIEGCGGVAKDPETGEISRQDFNEKTIITGTILPANPEMNAPERVLTDGGYMIEASKTRETEESKTKNAAGNVNDKEMEKKVKKLADGKMADEMKKRSRNKVIGFLVGGGGGYFATKYFDGLPPAAGIIIGGIAGAMIGKNL